MRIKFICLFLPLFIIHCSANQHTKSHFSETEIPEKNQTLVQVRDDIIKDTKNISLVATQSFTPVFDVIDQFQNGKELELKAHVGIDSFSFLRGQKTTITQSTFKRLQEDNKNSESQLIPKLKILQNGELSISYEINKSLFLEEVWKGDKPYTWNKIEFITIDSYPLKHWPEFIKQAVSHGLMEYEVVEHKEWPLFSLTFKQKDTKNFQFGKRSLKFTDEFYEYMKISNEFKPKENNTNKFVIFVHEPHWLLAGQYQLIPGLKSFIDSNSQNKYKFLVEGDYNKETKNIPTKPILTQFSKDSPNNIQVFSLVRNFLIDGQLAYRLLYDPNLPAEAIDDHEAILKTPREPEFKDWIEHKDIFIEISKKIEKSSQEQQQAIWKIANILAFYVAADRQDLKGQAFIDYSEEVEQLYNALADKLKSFSSIDLGREISFFESQAKSYRINTEILKYALKRDATMAENIVAHFRSNDSDRIPIVFIGNFHTPGIIERLPKEIGYVVIESRMSTTSVIPPKIERDNFNDALKPESRPGYLKRLGTTLKLPVAPLDKELPYYASFLKKESSKFKSHSDTFRSSSPLTPEDNSKILNTFEQNGFLNGVNINFGGGGNQPPPPFNGSFASFFYDPNGMNPKIIFYDREKDNWKHSDRLNYIKKIILIPPYEKLKKETRIAVFYQDRETKRIFFSVFDPNTQAFYLFEWKEGMDASKLLALPKTKNEEEAQIHLKLSIRRIFSKGIKDG